MAIIFIVTLWARGLQDDAFTGAILTDSNLNFNPRLLPYREPETARLVLRGFINATSGFEKP
jgi:hypothetical protein